ncbi:MAG: NAD(P)/FAD-dependent oxidoreductase [Marinomonas sp.]
MQISRRNFSLGAMGLGQALAMPACTSRAAKRYDAVVLGAGVSGLHTAHLLEQAGLSVAVLEARSRVGGRVMTLSDLPGHPEMGFNSMGSAYGRGLDLAKQLDVPMAEVGHRYRHGKPPGLYFAGEHLTREQWAQHAGNPFPAAMKSVMPAEIAFALASKNPPLADWTQWYAAENGALDIPFAQFLAQQGLSEEAIALAYNHIPYHGRDAGDVSNLLMAFNSGFVGSQMAAGPESFAAEGGNYKITDAMAARLKGDVLLDSPVAAIEPEGKGALVTCRDGARYAADKIVSSLPLPAFRQIELGFDVPKDQAEAHAETPYQPITIAHLTTSEPFWEQDGQSPSMWSDGFSSQVIAQRYGETADEVTGLMVQARGNLALEWDELGQDAVYDRLISELGKIRPATKGKLKPRHFHSWTQEEFSGGAWAYYKAGQATRFLAAMANPVGPVHFCGEHTEYSARGVEGALASAERAALEVVPA